MDKLLKKQIPSLTQIQRVWVLGVNIAIAFILYFFSINFSLSGSGEIIWLLAIIAYWVALLATAPFFVPPKDSLSIAISVILLMIPIDLSSVANFKIGLNLLVFFTVLISVVVVVLAIIAMFRKDEELDLLSQISFRISNILGKGEILFTPVIIVSAVGFYQDRPDWMLAIICFWILMVFIKPVELFFRIWIYVKNFDKEEDENKSIGSVIRIDTPNLVYVNLIDKELDWNSESVYITKMANGKLVYIVPLSSQVQDDKVVAIGFFYNSVKEKKDLSLIGIGDVYLASDISSKEICSELSTNKAANAIIGIVVENSSILNIKFKAVSSALEESMIIFLIIRGKKVYYQIINANTNEEKIEQNLYGFHIVKATQLGVFDSEDGFKKFPWLPDMNQPVFRVSDAQKIEQKIKEGEFLIGEVPNTSIGLPVVLRYLVEYHTAILGITGTGKTELTLEIIRNALERKTKVFCVDFTGEYKKRLKDYNPDLIGLDFSKSASMEDLLFKVETGTYGAPKERANLKDFLDTIQPFVEEQIKNFLENDEKKLGIFELPEITNTKATLRTTELYLSAIMKWAKEHRRAKSIMIVLEEAHTIIPEVYSSGFDNDTQWVVGRIGQIALQGRKYGVGLLIVSQRTALVNKTILSQCNTYFTHALVDKTSLEYLNGVYSSEHVQAIPSLGYLEFLAYGKAVKSERPILVKRKYDPKIEKACKALDASEEVKREIDEDEIDINDIPF